MSKADFLKYQAQTSPHPLAIEVSHAKGAYIYDTKGKAYLDFVAGVSANTLGHSHPEVNKAIKNQLDSYAHVMVYGEFIQKPAVELCKKMVEMTKGQLDSVYLTNSGTEATEAALKLAKRATGRSKIICAVNAYHGNTMGALSVCGNEEKKGAFRPLIPGIDQVNFNEFNDLEKIDSNTAAVILETIQGGAGFIKPEPGYLDAVKNRCLQTGALLILDEIQSGIGRTGQFFAYQHLNFIPDMVICGKGLGGGMPIGALMAKKELMSLFEENPKLGHITTFGGHPVIAAAALETLRVLERENLMNQVQKKAELFKENLKHSKILEFRGDGLMIALILKSSQQVNQVIFDCLDQGLQLFWLLYEPRAIRISPPLNISEKDIIKGCQMIIKALNRLEE